MFWLLLLAACEGRTVRLSNTMLPRDRDGNELVTGEASILSTGGLYYVYFNNWGGCPGVDCCASSGGCASCCFAPPSTAYPDACVYTGNHSFVAYSTPDFETWTNEGVVLDPSRRRPGIAFRPQVISCSHALFCLKYYFPLSATWHSSLEPNYHVYPSLCRLTTISLFCSSHSFFPHANASHQMLC